MAISGKRYLIWSVCMLAIGLSVAALAWLSAEVASPPLQSVSPFETVGWMVAGGELVVRAGPSGDDLLFAYFSSPAAMLWRDEDKARIAGRGEATVYRYVPSTSTWWEAGVDLWENAAGPVGSTSVFCGPDPTGELRFNPSSHRLSLRGTEVETAGKVVLEVCVVPDKSRAAILSADGPYERLWVGSSRVGGRRYHQVLTLIDGRLSSPIILERADADTYPILAWTPDLQHVVYHDMVLHLWVIPAVEKGEQKP